MAIVNKILMIIMFVFLLWAFVSTGIVMGFFVNGITVLDLPMWIYKVSFLSAGVVQCIIYVWVMSDLRENRDRKAVRVRSWQGENRSLPRN